MLSPDPLHMLSLLLNTQGTLTHMQVRMHTHTLKHMRWIDSKRERERERERERDRDRDRENNDFVYHGP